MRNDADTIQRGITMRVTRVENERAVNLCFVGKKYKNGSAWGQWWQNGWFDILESLMHLSKLNDNGYIGLMKNGNDGFEYWIGMFFDEIPHIPEGFESILLGNREFAVFHVCGNEKSGEIYGDAPTKACLDIIKTARLETSEECLRFERYNCPRYTTPDKHGNIILDYGFAIK